MKRSILLLGVLFPLTAGQRDPETLSSQGERMAAEKRFPEAEKLWRAAIQIAPDYFPALFNLGYLFYNLQQDGTAEPFLRRAAALAPKDFNTRYVLGSALVRLGRREDGLRQWLAALEIQPSNVRLMQVMSVEFSKGRYFLQSAEMANKALALQAEDSNLYFLAIKANQDAGQTEVAAEIAAGAAARFPESARANFEHAFYLQKTGRMDEAVPLLKRAMAADPGYEEPFALYGEILLRRDLSEEAIPYLRSAIRIRPAYLAARTSLAKAFMNLKKLPEAEAELQEAIRIEPGNPSPHLLLSQIYFRMAKEDAARKEKEISLRLRRDNPASMDVDQGRPFPPP